MRIFLTSFLVTLAIVGSAQYSKYFRKQTLRFDYYHSGNFEDEYVVPDELILEGKWAGPKKSLIDPFDYGSYKVMVYDSLSGNLIYTRQFSSLFVEYQATEQARSECGNFPESFLMPLPKKTVKVEYYSRGMDKVWNLRYEGFINPKNDEAIRKTGIEYPVENIVKAGKPKKNLDLVFLPEGYTEADMPKFLDDCRRFAGYLFETAPYGQYIKDINIRAVMAPSAEQGTDIPGDSIWRDTRLNSNFYTFDSDRYLTTSDFKAVRDVAASAPYDQIVILVNSPRYGGGGVYNFYAITSVDDRYSGFVFTHEFGHSFAGLGDEYEGSGSNDEDIYSSAVEPWEPNITTLADFGSKWQDMLPEGTPVPTPETDQWQGKLGVFEGAGYMTSGVYRPYPDCSMNVIKFNNFCPVCRRAIEQMIGYYVGR
jgi:hypothetical protein